MAQLKGSSSGIREFPHDFTRFIEEFEALRVPASVETDGYKQNP